MRRVLTNLIDNAIAAIRERAAARGRAGARAAWSVRTLHDAPLGTVRIEFEDDGVGIRPEDRRRIFEPYFSTKDHGTGLGLAIVSRIVADHHGYVRVHANRPRGRPLHRGAAPAKLVGEAGAAVNRILIVDDEASIRRSLAGILSDEGFSPAEAPDGEAALAELRGESPPDLVLLDIAMPGPRRRRDPRGDAAHLAGACRW